jgi:hypothetical protein
VPRTLHHDQFWLEPGGPIGQGSTVAFEGAKLALLDTHRPVWLFEDGAGGDLGLVNVQSDDTLVNRGNLHFPSLCDTLKEEGGACLN